MSEKEVPSIGKAAAAMLRAGVNNVMLEETQAGPAIAHGGMVYFPWQEERWRLNQNDQVALLDNYDTAPIAPLMEKWERGTITTISWEDLQMKAKMNQKGKTPAGASPIPGDPRGSTTAPKKPPAAPANTRGATPAPAPKGKAVPPPGKGGKKAAPTPAEIPDPAPTGGGRKSPTPLPPNWVEQDSYKMGIRERIDTTLYTNHIKCEVCGADRWTKVQDAFQVTKCKPCAKRDRRKRREANRRARRAGETKVVITPTAKTKPKPKPTPKPKPKK
jgi:hypothetical protein